MGSPLTRTSARARSQRREYQAVIRPRRGFAKTVGLLTAGFAAFASSAVHASAAPPAWALDFSGVGIGGPGFCLSYKYQTGFGPFHDCVRFGGSPYSMQLGIYSPITKQFYARGPYLPFIDFGSSGPTSLYRCSDGSYFKGYFWSSSGFGPLSLGSVFRLHAGRWQAAPGYYGHIIGNCSTATAWQNIEPL